MNKKPSPTKTTGRVSAGFIAALQNRGKSIFSIDEAQAICGKRRSATVDLLRDLVNRGILARIKSGTFLILQTGNENTQLRNWPVIARELAGKDPYFISHYSAMRIHGMTSHPIVNVYLTLTKQKPDKIVSNITYHFIYSKEKHFWGQMSHWATKQEQVWVSDPERTLLDGFDRPDLCGGITDVVRGLWATQKNINSEKLVNYAKQYRTKAAVKRLGYVLEALNIAPNTLPVLGKEITDAKDYVTLDPQGKKEGKRLSRWRIQLNINADELKAGVWG